MIKDFMNRLIDNNVGNVGKNKEGELIILDLGT